MTTLEVLQRNYSALAKLFEEESSRSAASTLGKTSGFWVDLLARRPNLPDVNEFLAFRRANFGYGMADERQGDLERERTHAKRIFEIFRHTVEPEKVASIDEPALGAPYVFSNGGTTRSAAFWVNAATAHRVADFVRAYTPQACRLRVLEIGAGWGAAAYQLHKLLDISTYVIADLPENLLLSNMYLSATLDRPLALLSCSGATVETLPTDAIVGLLPAALERIKTKFDLIINSFSLQEMELDTVNSYMSWIMGALSDTGIFVSFNSHGKSGIRRPSDYNFESFHVRHIGMFRRFPSGFFNTIPYEVVLSCPSGAVPKADRGALNSLGCLYQLGLDGNLDVVASQVVAGTASEQDLQTLSAFAQIFSGSGANKSAALSSPAARRVPEIADYLLGHCALASGRREEAAGLFKSACRLGLTGFAALRSDAICATIERRPMSSPSLGLNAEFAYPELSRTVQDGDVGPFLVHLNRVLSS